MSDLDHPTVIELQQTIEAVNITVNHVCRNNIEGYSYSELSTFLFLFGFNKLNTVTVVVHNCTVCWRLGVVASVVRRMNEVTVHWARLVLGWVTVFGRVYHHGV